MCVSIGGALKDLKSLTQEKKPRLHRQTHTRTTQSPEKIHIHLFPSSQPSPNFFMKRKPLGSQYIPHQACQNSDRKWFQRDSDSQLAKASGTSIPRLATSNMKLLFQKCMKKMGEKKLRGRPQEGPLGMMAVLRGQTRGWRVIWVIRVLCVGDDSGPIGDRPDKSACDSRDALGPASV